MKISRVRAVVASVVILATLGSFVAHVGFGSYSSFGFAGLSYACPVGILEGMLGAKSFDWTGLFCLAVVVVVALVAGKAFCSWICPTPWVRRIFGTGGSTKRSFPGQRVHPRAGIHVEIGSKPARRAVRSRSRRLAGSGTAG